VPDPPADYSSVEPIRPDHRCESFDCGKPPLNDWLKRFALQSQRSDGPLTLVVHQNLVVMGYYSLTTRHVLKSEGPDRLGRGLGNYPIGVVLLARLAVDVSAQKIGLGRALLKDAMMRVDRISQDVGVRALIVEAIDTEAQQFYERHGFTVFPNDSSRLMVLMKDLRANLRSTVN
jgi:GNAT superfamily N-acetyltransferase